MSIYQPSNKTTEEILADKVVKYMDALKKIRGMEHNKWCNFGSGAGETENCAACIAKEALNE